MPDIVTIGPIPTDRGHGDQPLVEFAIRSATITWAWGATPSPGAVTWVSSTGEYPKILPGAQMTITLFGQTFYGIAQGGPMVYGSSVVPTEQSSAGNEVELRFVDTRLYLAWDRVFGTFNQVESRVVNGVWLRRYWHIYPADWVYHKKTYTNSPLTARQILDKVFADPRVGTTWLRQYHPDQELAYPKPVDCMGGRALNDVIQEVCETQGLTLTLYGGNYNLLFARKGGGALPEFPSNADDLKLEQSMSEAPTRVFVVGDRNLYMVLNIAMEPDWNREWEAVFHVDLLTSDLYHNEKHTDDQDYDSMTGDTEHVVGWQLAAARAKSITVGEYAELRRLRTPTKDFKDQRKYMGRARSQMPAALYIQTMVFKAFRPPPNLLIEGVQTPVEDLQMVNDQVAFISHDYETGAMTATLTPPADRGFSGGNGYIVFKGYNLGGDLFGMIQPERFDIDVFNGQNDLWQPMTGSVDESGEGSQFILMDDPIINSSDLVTEINSFAVLKANPTITIPECHAALTFEGPRFVRTVGSASRDEVLNVGGLRRELVITSQDVQDEVPYADGKFAWERADDIGNAFLSRNWFYRGGGYTLKLADGESAPAITPQMGRLTLQKSAQGNVAIVEFERDRFINHYVPEGTLDRLVREQAVLPGQDQLKAEAHTHQLLAKGLKGNPKLVSTLKHYLQQSLGQSIDPEPVNIADGTTATLAAGTPLWKKGMTKTGGTKANTRPVMPASTTADHNVFSGVTVRDGEISQNQIRVQSTGRALVRVMGPVAVNDSVVLSPGNDYLAKSGATSAPSVGSAQMAIETAAVELIPVRLGTSGGGSGRQVWS